MTYINLFWTFLKIGLFTFGGGYAMIPLIQQEVIRNGWLSSEELIDFIAISESTPGPFAVNISTFVGMKTGGVIGAASATVGVILPSLVVILLVARAYEKFEKSRLVKGAMLGLKGAVVGLIGATVISTGVTVFENSVQILNVKEIIAIVIMIIALSFGLAKKVHPIVLIVLSAVCGIIVMPFIN